MISQMRIEIRIGHQHRLHLVGIGALARNLPGKAAVVHVEIVQLVRLVAVSSPAMLRHREAYFALQGPVGIVQHFLQGLVEEGHLPHRCPHRRNRVPGQEQARVRLGSAGSAESQAEGKDYCVNLLHLLDSILPESSKLLPPRVIFSQGASSRRMA